MNPYDDNVELKGGLAELFPHTFVHRTIGERLTLLMKGKGWKPEMELVFDKPCLMGIDTVSNTFWRNK